MYTVPASPMYSEGQQTDLSERGGGVGVTFDGGFVYSAYGGPTYGQVVDFGTSAPRVEGDTFDACGGHSSSATEASYHYHVPPVCLLHQLGAAEGAPSPQVGWMLDGFPIYGPLGPGGTQMKTCTVTGGTVGVDVCTDDCGGYYGDTGDGYLYRYYFLGEYNDGTCCTTPIDPQFAGGEDYFPFTPICLRGCCPHGTSCSFNLPRCSDDATDGTTTRFEATAVAALAINTGTCAAEDMCCDSTLNSRCPPARPCDECAYEFAGEAPRNPLPTPAPTPTGPTLEPVVPPTPTPTLSMSPVSAATPAPTPRPTLAPTPRPSRRPHGPPPRRVTVAVSVVLGGVTCSAFGAAEETAFIAAVLATLPGLVEDDLGPLTCAAAAASRRRRPLDDAAAARIAFDATVADADFVSATLGAAVSSGSFTSGLVAAAADAGSAALLDVVATGVEVSTLAPTPAPTRAPSTSAPSADDDKSSKPIIDKEVVLAFFGIIVLGLVCCCICFVASRSGAKQKKEKGAQLELTSTQPAGAPARAVV